MDYSKKTLVELVTLCKERGIKGCSGKPKAVLIEKLMALDTAPVVAPSTAPAPAVASATSATGLRMIDLFAGTGAFTHAFEGTGKVQCVFANDMVEWSKKLYDANFSHELTLQDLNTVRKEDVPAHDILTGGFPCFVAGTRVLTDKGYKKIEEVDLEDKLLTHTGNYQRILNRQVKVGATDLFSVDIKYHPHSIICTPEHPFYVRQRAPDGSFSAPEWVEASKLTEDDYVGMVLEKSRPYLSANPNNKHSLDDMLETQRYCLNAGIVFNLQYDEPTRKYSYEAVEVNDENIYIEGQYAWRKINFLDKFTVEPETVYNFEVEHDNSYVVENTIVHNCQPFSIAGKQEGFDDARSNVFWKILELIDHHTPRAIILENVKNLVSHDDGRTFEIIKKNLTDRGYHLRFKVLNTAEITGVPQHRERIYIVCLKDKAVFDKFTLDFPEIPKRTITDMLEPAVADKYYYTEASSTWPLVSVGVTKHDTVYQYRRVYVRENKSNECPTLTANMGGGGHNVPLVRDARGIRKLTPRECFNFQGFPASYVMPAGMSDTNLYKLAGNAVSVPVVKLIAERLVPLLEGAGVSGSTSGGGAGHA